MRPLERWLVRKSSWVVGLTGLIYFWMKYLMEPSEPWAAINHPLQPLVLKAHILVAPVFIFAVGTIFLSHIWKHLVGRVAAGRRSGLLLALSVVPMILTGYLVQTVVRPVWLSAVAWAHIGLGGLFLAGFAAHLMAFQRGRNRKGVSVERRDKSCSCS